jgi:hypothetical protein
MKDSGQTRSEDANQWQCCFYGETIDAEDKLLISVSSSDDGQHGLACHSRCLETRLHPSVPFLGHEGAAESTI